MELQQAQQQRLGPMSKGDGGFGNRDSHKQGDNDGQAHAQKVAGGLPKTGL